MGGEDGVKDKPPSQRPVFQCDLRVCCGEVLRNAAGGGTRQVEGCTRCGVEDVESWSGKEEGQQLRPVVGNGSVTSNGSVVVGGSGCDAGRIVCGSSDVAASGGARTAARTAVALYDWAGDGEEGEFLVMSAGTCS